MSDKNQKILKRPIAIPVRTDMGEPAFPFLIPGKPVRIIMLEEEGSIILEQEDARDVQ